MATFTLPQQSRAAGTYKVPPSNPPQIPAGSTQIAFQLNLIAADFTNTANLITYGVYSSSLPDGSDAKLEITGDWQGGARLQPQGVLSSYYSYDRSLHLGYFHLKPHNDSWNDCNLDLRGQ
jgi:hypothetical protein